MALRTKKEDKSKTFSPSERSAIKGLRPFESDDAEIFVRLQRQDILRECLDAVTHKDFRFGILCGESGCGKTSFLQAGLLPMIPEQSASCHCIYVKFTDLDPFESVRQAIREQAKLSLEEIEDTDFLTLTEYVAELEGKTLILLFDQFEQFFVHHKTQEQRKPFVDALTEWYQKNPAPPIKILVSLRGDFIPFAKIKRPKL